MSKYIIRYMLLFLTGFLLFFASCDSNRVFEENKEIKDNNWKMQNKIFFSVIINDTVSSHNLYINVRNAGFYQFGNIFLFLSTTLPDGKTAIDTVECVLADADGKWKGNGLGDIWDNRLLFKKNFVFPQSGEYRFELEQAMRINPLPGIMDVGIRIEKVSQK